MVCVSALGVFLCRLSNCRGPWCSGRCLHILSIHQQLSMCKTPRTARLFIADLGKRCVRWCTFTRLCSIIMLYSCLYRRNLPVCFKSLFSLTFFFYVQGLRCYPGCWFRVRPLDTAPNAPLQFAPYRTNSPARPDGCFLTLSSCAFRPAKLVVQARCWLRVACKAGSAKLLCFVVFWFQWCVGCGSGSESEMFQKCVLGQLEKTIVLWISLFIRALPVNRLSVAGRSGCTL